MNWRSHDPSGVYQLATFKSDVFDAAAGPSRALCRATRRWYPPAKGGILDPAGRPGVDFSTGGSGKGGHRKAPGRSRPSSLCALDWAELRLILSTACIKLTAMHPSRRTIWREAPSKKAMAVSRGNCRPADRVAVHCTSVCRSAIPTGVWTATPDLRWWLCNKYRMKGNVTPRSSTFSTPTGRTHPDAGNPAL